MSENVDNEEGIPESITGDFSLNKLLEKEAEKIKKRQGITDDRSLGELLDMEKDGFAVTEQNTDKDEKQARQELSKKHAEEVRVAQEELTKRKLHDYTIEILYHFNCGECKGWWSYATTPGQPIIDHNTKLIVGDKMFLYEGIDIYCPHCGHCENTKIKEGFLENFSDEQKASSKRSVIRFIIGVAIGLYTGIAIMFALSSAEHQRMHDLLEQHGIEEHDH